MSKVIYLPFQGSLGGGGPHIFVHKFTAEVVRRGFKVIYDKPQRSDVALGIIETGKILKKVNRAKTRVCVRLDNAYFRGWWNGSPGREWRPDMSALHRAIARDFHPTKGVDHVIFQSEFSRKLICSEIAERKDRYSIIHNGVDVKQFSVANADQNFRNSLVAKIGPKNLENKIVLIHHAKMRNGYIMESLLGVLDEIKKRGHNAVLLIVGNMDAECSAVYNNHSKKDVYYLGPIPNNKLPSFLSLGSIYLAPRMGSSSDNCIVEALSMSLPPVVGAWGGNSELLVDGQSGMIADGGEWNYNTQYIQNLSNGVEQIIPDLHGFKRRARKHAVKTLNLDRMLDLYLRQAMKL
jgi:glycosyltransferase involved in cell wall biosynthesis